MHDLTHQDGYPLSRSLAWHGVANGDSQQELEFLFGDKDLHTARLASREASRPSCSLAQLFLRFRHFLSLPLLPPTEDFMAFQAAAVSTLSICILLK